MTAKYHRCFLLLLKLLFTLNLWLNTNGASALVALQYHHIDNSTPRLTSISPALFENHIKYLTRNNFEVIPSTELVELIKSKSPKLNHADKFLAVITFDDGYQSILTNALPTLSKSNLPFTVFINPSLVGTAGYLDWQQLATLQARGGIIANHTMSHPHLIRQQPEESKSQWLTRIKSEILDAEEIIEDKLGVSHKQLAYPYGEYNHEIKTLVEEMGFTAFSQHSGAIGRDSDPQALPRFAFGGDYGDINQFIDKANSLPMPLAGMEVKNGDQVLIDPLLPQNLGVPELILTTVKPLSVTCFASGQGKITTKQITDLSVSVTANKPLPVGRSRYNCTSPTQTSGRFYWYSQPFYRKLDNGEWYSEY